MAGIPGLAHGITTRAGGVSVGAYASLNLGLATAEDGTADDGEAVAANRSRVSAALGFERLLTPYQVHGAAVLDLAEGRPSRDDRFDGILSSAPGPLIGVLGADCPGVLLVAPAQRVLVVAHAGWRGIAARIVPEALRRLIEDYGATPASILAGVGPGISAARYEVSDGVAQKLRNAVPAAAHAAVALAGRPGHAQADLQAAIQAQLIDGGVAAARIEVHRACTFDDARFFSHRQDQGITGRHALVAGWL